MKTSILVPKFGGCPPERTYYENSPLRSIRSTRSGACGGHPPSQNTRLENKKQVGTLGVEFNKIKTESAVDTIMCIHFSIS